MNSPKLSFSLSVLEAHDFVLNTLFEKNRILASLGIIFNFVLNICICDIWKLITAMKLNPLIGVESLFMSYSYSFIIEIVPKSL